MQVDMIAGAIGLAGASGLLWSARSLLRWIESNADLRRENRELRTHIQHLEANIWGLSEGLAACLRQTPDGSADLADDEDPVRVNRPKSEMQACRVLSIDPLRPISREVLSAAYRRAIKQAHPDAGGNPETFRDVQEAYDLLTKTCEK
ncbi:DnaJ family molecular chaperone [Leisingera sp. XS_AS12]|uniref:J domain-containing protein n=1 Tax=Leisingera sp. XS_AS12 TaxID=3241294 RepID=UPI0035198BA1